MPWKGIAGCITEAPQFGAESHGGARWQLDEQILAFHANRVLRFAVGSIEVDFTKVMLTKSTGLYDEPSRLIAVTIHQLHADTITTQFINKGRRIGGETRSESIGIVVSDRSAQQTAIVDRLRCPRRDLGQGLGQHYVHGHTIALDDVQMAALVFNHFTVTTQSCCVFGA